MIIFLGLGLVVGIVSGLLGIGGGIILIPGLMWLEGMDQRRAAGMTLAVLSLPVVLPACWRYLTAGDLHFSDLGNATLIAAGFAVGGYLGAHLVDEIDVATLKLLFGMMLLFVGVRSMLSSDRDAAAAFYGILTTVLAWLGFVGLRMVGRRHAPPPDLASKIKASHKTTTDPLDYSI